MIQRIESGWVQVNDALSKQERRQRRRHKKHRDVEREEERNRTLDEEKATFDVLV